MIEVIERHAVRRKQIRCESCGSLLEYGNEDLRVERHSNAIYSTTISTIEWPVCRCIISAPILKPNNGGQNNGR